MKVRLGSFSERVRGYSHFGKFHVSRLIPFNEIFEIYYSSCMFCELLIKLASLNRSNMNIIKIDLRLKILERMKRRN